MQIQFLGATQNVTGSKFLLTWNKQKVLVDCGLYQGLKELRLRNWEEPVFDPKTLHAVVLTHAHIDHSGYVPLLVKKGFRGKIYCTDGTLDLCKILLPDAGYLQEEEARFANMRKFSKHDPAEPLFTFADAVQSLTQFEAIALHQEFTLLPGLSFQFKSGGHIIGAASAHFHFTQKTLVFSGDVGRFRDVVMRAPEPLTQADYLVLESTYGNRKHGDVDPLMQLQAVAERTLKRGGVLVIPAFAVGRAQAVLYLLTKLKHQKQIPNVPIYLNSPMSQKATTVFIEHMDEHKLTAAQCKELQDEVICINTPEESYALNEKTEPMIIVSASGMATGGRVVHHIKAFGPNAKNTILIVGFQAAGTRGEALLHGVDEIKIHGEYHKIRAEIASIDGLSAHADAAELVDCRHMPMPQNWWIGLKRSKCHPKMFFWCTANPVHKMLCGCDSKINCIGPTFRFPNSKIHSNCDSQ